MSSFEQYLTDDLGLHELEDFALGFRERYGTYQVGIIEEDPEMQEYEELLDLGLSLRNVHTRRGR